MQPVGGGDDTPDTLPNVSATQGKPGSTASNKATQQNNKTTVAKEPESRTVKITIPEGYNIVQIARKLEANGVCSGSGFYQYGADL